MHSPKKISFAAEQLKKQQKKKTGLWVSLAVAGIVIVIGGYALYVWYGSKNETVSLASEDLKSIAVLPFENLSDDKEDEYFSDGITDDIMLRLSKIHDLKVISRTSVMRYKGTDKSLPEIGKELDVAAVLEGTVRRSDNRVRITVQLINAKTDAHIWADQYGGDLDDIFAVQAEISEAIVNELKVTLKRDEKIAISKQPTDDMEAYDFYLLGKHNINIDRANGAKKALDYFKQAVDRDQGFALGYAGISLAYSRLGYSNTLPPPEAYPKAKEAAEKALQLDDSLSEAYSVLGWINIYYDWDWNAAEKNLKRAIELNPNFPNAHHNYRDYLIIMGRWDEAITEIERAQSLDPLTPLYGRLALYTYVIAGRYSEARTLYNRLMKTDKTFKNTNFEYSIPFLIDIYQGEHKRAVEILENKKDRFGDKTFFQYYYAWGCALAGNRSHAEKIILDYKDNQNRAMFHNSYSCALLSLTMGDIDEAFAWLDKAYEEHLSYLPYIRTFPEFEPLREDPRYNALLEKIGLGK